MGDCSTGIPALERAAELMPEVAPVHANLSYAYGVERRFGEAETAARTALKLDWHLSPAHYLLGRFLVRRRASLEEAAEHLKLARDQVPAG
jgi:tetratricopeptide (TPR) repeat protein